MVYEFDCICIVCGRRTSVLWTEQMAILYQQSGLLKCADCRGAILIERSDLGAIGSAHAVRTSRYETPVKTRPGA